MENESGNRSDPQRKEQPIAPPPRVFDRSDMLMMASERLSQVRYVFSVQIEDGIPTAFQRAALEYSDAVLMGWPDSDDTSLSTPTAAEQTVIKSCEQAIERHLDDFRLAERDDKTDDMGDKLIQISDNVAQIRKFYQPDFLLPTFSEIKRVVSEEWDEDMNSVDSRVNDRELAAASAAEPRFDGTAEPPEDTLAKARQTSGAGQPAEREARPE